ncbi:MAG: DUF4426 domain-containing protein [Pseudomonadota bacterium]|nr:DUF4426 domain-containing protein [Pseudomonadota bacterium]
MKKIKQVSILLITLLCACNSGEKDIPQAPNAQNNVFHIGEYTVYLNTSYTKDISNDIAIKYGIKKSDNRIMLNVSILKNQSRKSAEGAITIDVTNLLGQKKAVKEMKVVENDSVSYAFFSDISNQETLIYNLSISPEENYSKKIQYTNKFFID